MYLIFTILFLSGTLFIASPTLAAVKIEYLPPSPTQQIEHQWLTQQPINALFTSLSDDHFRFSQAVTLQYGSDDGPLYDPEHHQIQIPYEFISHTRSALSQLDDGADFDSQQAAVDSLLHTLLHEAGHAFIVDQDIAILGKEEDAADHFAAIIMLNYLPQGDIALLNAGNLFALESEQKPQFYDFGEYMIPIVIRK
ncbi:DUF4344 domain-containing metallopeptidase [Shewanella waksmanii]|uniref:DUF4344 domain-containing metallopeptidase n=1 Tax=Shewanella waksmanii TaxID=213783 RepID=UPI0037364C62